MEWIETTAATVAEAKDLAIDKLGVDESETEFEVLEEPQKGLFGRMRGQARVRARVSPKSPRAKEERGDRRRNRKRRSGPGGADRPEAERSNEGRPNQERSEQGARSSRRPETTQKQSATPENNESRGGRKMEQTSVDEVAGSVERFLNGLVSAFGLESEVGLDHDADEVRAEIKGKHGLLLGPKARTLDAIQELARVTASREAPSGIRVKVDVGGYREARKLALGDFAVKAAERARAEGIEVVLEPMSSADRKIIHDTINDIDGVSTRSAGNDPRRRVVVVPDGATSGSSVGNYDGDDGDDSDS